MRFIEKAQRYIDLGWPVVPCRLTNEPNGRVNKRPLLQSWRDYQHRLPTQEELAIWNTTWPHANIGIITGALPGLFVVDIDVGATKEDIASLSLPPTAMVQTPSGGFHAYFRHPGGTVKTCAGVAGKKHIDIRGDGGFIVVPPSTYPDGRAYEWQSPPEDGLAEAPKSLIETIGERNNTDWRELSWGVSQGSRNANLTQLVGLMTRYMPRRYWDTVCWPLIQAWNEQNSPPLPTWELMLTFNSISAKEERVAHAPPGFPEDKDDYGL